MSILQNFSPVTIATAIEQNAIEGCQAWRQWAEVRVGQEPDVSWTCCNRPFPLFNNVFGARFAPDQAEARIEAALARAQSRRLPLMWWIGPTSQPVDLVERLLGRGFQPTGYLTGMALELAKLPPLDQLPVGLTIEPVRDGVTFRQWCQVMTPVYEFSSPVASTWFELFTAIGLTADRAWQHFLARRNGIPVATASLFFGAGVAGLANVATAPGVRRQGIATALVWSVLRLAHQEGFRLAVLFASQMGESIYRRLGFRVYCQERFYLWPGDR